MPTGCTAGIAGQDVIPDQTPLQHPVNEDEGQDDKEGGGDIGLDDLAAADVGLNVPSVVTVGTVSGALFTSNMTVNATGKATTSTLPWRVVALMNDDAGVFGNRALVRANATTSNIGATGT